MVPSGLVCCLSLHMPSARCLHSIPIAADAEDSLSWPQLEQHAVGPDLSALDHLLGAMVQRGLLQETNSTDAEQGNSTSNISEACFRRSALVVSNIAAAAAICRETRVEKDRWFRSRGAWKRRSCACACSMRSFPPALKCPSIRAIIYVCKLPLNR